VKNERFVKHLMRLILLLVLNYLDILGIFFFFFKFSYVYSVATGVQERKWTICRRGGKLLQDK
jgi:hypothetical protein